MTLGFVGLGQMGKPIALNLLKSKSELLVVDRSEQSFEIFRTAGARASTSVADVADADLIFLCLPNGKVVQDIVLGEKGLLRRLKPGQTIVDLSTISHSETTQLGLALASRDVAFIDAPISGMEARAVDGTLTVMCGGNRE